MIKTIFLILWKLLWLPVYFVDMSLRGDNPFDYTMYIVVNTDAIKMEVTPWLGVLLCMIEWYLIYSL